MDTSPRGELERLYRSQRGRMWQAVFAFAGDPEVASDAVAEAFTQALGRGDAIRSPERWLWRTVFRIAAGELKARRRVGPERTEGTYEMNDLARDLVAALAKLSAKQRAAVVLHHAAGYPAKEIARIMVPPLQPFMSNSAGRASASASSWRSTMPSLDDHFNALTKVRPPEGWPDLSEGGTRAPAPPPRHRLRAGTAVLAFVVATAGFLFAIRAFRMERTGTPSSAVQNGVIAFARGGPQSGLYSTNPDGTGLTKLPSVPGDTDPASSPDGSKIAFVRFREGSAGIWVMNADGTGARRITDGGPDVDGTDLGPAWSPDGSRIAFAREGRPAKASTGNTDIYVVNADGTDVVRLTDDPMMEYAPTWSPDGSRIAFAAYDLASGGQPPSPLRLYVMNADGTDMEALGPENVEGVAWSPDGTEIAFVDTDTGSIMAIHPDGTGQRRIVDAAELVGGVHLVGGATWSPDETQIAFMAGADSTDTHIYVVSRDGSDVRQVTDGPAPDAEPAWQSVPAPGVSPPAVETPRPKPADAISTPTPPSGSHSGMFAAMLEAIRASSPPGWTFTLGSDRLDGDWRLDGDADDGSGPGRLSVDVILRPGMLEADPCADREFRQGARCARRPLPNGDLLVLRDIVIDPGHMKTIEVVLVHPDRSGVGAEAGNWTIATAEPTPISESELPTPRVTRPDPLYTVDQLAQLVLAVDERIKECMRTSCL